MREVKSAGHECGIHAWDHVDWHDRLPAMRREEVSEIFARAASRFEEIFGERARVAGAPGWTATPLSVEAYEASGIEISSDSRGGGPFRPLRPDGTPSKILEIPSTLPTLDELLALPLPGAGSRGGEGLRSSSKESGRESARGDGCGGGAVRRPLRSRGDRRGTRISRAFRQTARRVEERRSPISHPRRTLQDASGCRDAAGEASDLQVHTGAGDCRRYRRRGSMRRTVFALAGAFLAGVLAARVAAAPPRLALGVDPKEPQHVVVWIEGDRAVCLPGFRGDMAGPSGEPAHRRRYRLLRRGRFPPRDRRRPSPERRRRPDVHPARGLPGRSGHRRRVRGIRALRRRGGGRLPERRRRKELSERRRPGPRLPPLPYPDEPARSETGRPRLARRSSTGATTAARRGGASRPLPSSTTARSHGASATRRSRSRRTGEGSSGARTEGCRGSRSRDLRRSFAASGCRIRRARSTFSSPFRRSRRGASSRPRG